MKIKFSAILSTEKALKAVKNDGCNLQFVTAELRTEDLCLKAVEDDVDALRLVLNLDLFKKIANKLSIEIDI